MLVIFVFYFSFVAMLLSNKSYAARKPFDFPLNGATFVDNLLNPFGGGM